MIPASSKRTFSRQIIAIVFASLPLCTVQSAQLERMQFLMGTTATVQVWGHDSTFCERALDAAFAELADVDHVMSTYKPDSQISRLNREGATDWVKIDPRFYQVLQSATYYSDLTEGAFDITLLPLMRLWGFRDGIPQIPHSDVLQATLRNVGSHHIYLHPNMPQVRFNQANLQLDLGGIAKGYALDRAAGRLKALGATAGVLNLGGNFLTFGTRPETVVGIQHPKISDQLLGTFEIEHGSVATSGGYEKYVTINGKSYGHILDPRTGTPAKGLISATVVAPTGTAADALATALFVLGPQKGAHLLKTLDYTEGILAWDGEDGTLQVYISPGLQSTFHATDPDLLKTPRP
ncbi:MAG: FAD:protein FMN transferase [bacterium]|nr:FAD:protein FMN transferase [bacterium]